MFSEPGFKSLGHFFIDLLGFELFEQLQNGRQRRSNIRNHAHCARIALVDLRRCDDLEFGIFVDCID